MRRLLIGTAFVVMLGIGAPAARAQSYVHFNVPGIGTAGSAVTKNLYVDLIFWGWGEPFTDPVSGALRVPSDAQDVLNNVQDIASWLNTGWVFDHTGSNAPVYLPAHLGQGGWEPAVHSYGVSGVTPGLWISDYTDAIPWWTQAFPVGTGSLDHGDFASIVDHAQTGTLGPARDFQGNIQANNLPIGANRIALVITKGTNPYCITPDNLPGYIADSIPANTCELSNGFHDWRASQGVTEPYGAAESDASGPMNVLSHELMEAMTDPITFGGWTGTHTDIPLALVTTPLVGPAAWILPDIEIPDEVADECENASSNGDGGFAWLTVDAPYNMATFAGGWKTSSANCSQLIPEQHAPMAATFEYGGNGTQPLHLVYIDTNGHLQELSWDAAGQPASNPYDLGQPSSSPVVKATGKPAIVYDTRIGGERIFVKGTDQAVWMYYDNSWTSLGGMIFGDPQAVVWSWQGLTWTHVFALGLDDNLYMNGIAGSNAYGYGWGGYPDFGTRFVGSPAVVTRDGTSIDVYIVGEDTQLKRLSFTTAAWWAAPVNIASNAGYPFVSTPAVTQLNQTLTQVAATQAGAGNGWMWAGSYNGASWPMTGDGFQLSGDTSYGPNGWDPSGATSYGNLENYGFQGTPAVVGGVDGGNGRADVFAVTRTGELFWFYTSWPWHYGTTPFTGGLDNPPLVSGDVTGDPIAISRGTGELEVFYRTGSGALVHKWTTTALNNGVVWPSANTETLVADHPMM